MDFEYRFEITPEFGLKMKILPNEQIKGDIFMIGAWLYGDVQSSDTLYKCMKEFMENSEIEKANFGGNACDVFTDREFATIRWEWYDEVPESCTLPTQMLYEILQIWVAKQKELRENEE